HHIDPSTGRIFAGVQRSASTGASGSGSLLTITFRATGKEGKTQVHVVTAVPTIVGGGTMPVRGGGSQQLRVTSVAGKL
ncbi:MAG: hypothetical protein WCL29_05510, partial [Pseudomonadota bacterium]